MDMLLYIFIIVLLLFSIGSYFFQKLVPQSPYSLKREPVKFYFDKSLSKDDLGKFVQGIQCKKKKSLAMIGILAVAILLFVYSLLKDGYIEYIVYIIPLSGILLYFTDKIICSIEIYENALVYKRFLRKKTYFYSKIDCIETYNVVNNFNKGTGFGYQITKGGNPLIRFDNDNFENIIKLEEIFLNHFPGVERTEKQETTAI